MAKQVALPPTLKPLDRYLKTALQVEKVEPLVAYACRHYAIEQGMELRQKGANDPATKSFLLSLMDRLEAEKGKIEALGVPNKQEYLQNFALRVFKVADDADRSGVANKSTARNFLHASIFFEVLKQYGPLKEELKEMQKYSKWRATEIAAAEKEGRAPVPPADSGVDELNELDLLPAAPAPVQPVLLPSYTPTPQNNQGILPVDVPTPDFSTPSVPEPAGFDDDLSNLLPEVPAHVASVPITPIAPHTAPRGQTPPATQQYPQPSQRPTQPTQPQAPQHQKPASHTPTPPPQQTYTPPPQQQAFQPPPQHYRPQPQSQPQPQPPQQQVYYQTPSYVPSQLAPSGYAPNDQQLLDAQKFAKYSVSALQFDDVPTAIKNLKLALGLLTGQQFQ